MIHLRPLIFNIYISFMFHFALICALSLINASSVAHLHGMSAISQFVIGVPVESDEVVGKSELVTESFRFFRREPSVGDRNVRGPERPQKIKLF